MWFLKVFLKMELRNGSRFYKNAYKVFVSKDVFVNRVSESVLKNMFCNGSRLYKNVYKVFVSKIVQRRVCEMCFESILKRYILCNGSRLYKNAYK